MRMLVLGGSVFLGSAIVRAAIGNGHEVTTFTRGISGRVPEGAVAIRGDRSAPHGMETVGSGLWDVVVDVSRSPYQVKGAMETLVGRTPHYIFVSTTSVYADLISGPLTAATAVVDAATDADEGVPSAYPNLKVRCEQVVRNSFPDSHLVVRPGLIVGPGDLTDRFTYWVERTARPGPILAPGRPERRVRFTDVRDLAGWIVAAAENRVEGTFNAVGPAARMSMSELLDACLVVAGRQEEHLQWIPDDFLLEEGVEPYTELPLWVPELPELKMFAEADSRPAELRGLTFRPIEKTIADTLRWSAENDQRTRDNGLAADREAQLLERWRARGAGDSGHPVQRG